MARIQLTPEEKRTRKLAQRREWGKRHPERHRQARARDPKKVRVQERAADKRKWERDPEKMRAHARVRESRWRAKHPERVREIRHKSREKHLEKCRARYRAWALGNSRRSALPRLRKLAAAVAEIENILAYARALHVPLP
jgi:hypothetical protein